MHLAEEDEFMGKDAQAWIRAWLAQAPGAMIYRFPGYPPAFARRGGLHHQAKAATSANAWPWAFLAEHLGLAVS